MHWVTISKGVIPIFILHDENMDKIDLPKGVIPLDVFISSIGKERELESIEGKSGVIDYGFLYKERNIELKLLLKAKDTRDYRLIRDEVYDTLDRIYYVSEEYQPGKIYRVSVDTSYIPERYSNNNQRFAEAEVNCTVVGLPFSESIGTTKDIDKNGINSEAELWGYGMGLIADDDSLIYTHTKNNFMIYNAGNVPVHPFEQQLKITIDDVRGSSKEFQLRNKTNGTTFKVNEGVKGNQEIVLDGANITSNGLAYLRKTNKQYIVLEKGWNEFEVNGATSARISFDFKFYYL